MKARAPRCLCLILVWLVGAGWESRLVGQSLPAASPDSALDSNSAPTPPFPVFHPRTQFFRDLLAMKSSEREQFLASRPAQNRAPLAAKIQEYEAMTPEQRDSILHATQLHEYLQYFVQMPPDQRAPQLALIPEDYRSEVTNRLQMFDLLPPPLQKEVLSTDSTKAYFTGAVSTNTIRAVVPPPMPPDPFASLSRLTPEQRENLYATFEHFFDLSDEDRQTILAALPIPERAQVQRTLKELEQLPRDQREQGLKSISKLAAMTEEQRQVFFANAEKWKQMTPAERETWRKMATHLPPPPPPPLPPLAHPRTSRSGVSLATNPTN